MRRCHLLFVLPLLVAACGGAATGTATCADRYWDGAVGVCLPEEWNVVEREVLRQRGVPEEVIAAFQSEKSVSGQFPTVTVTRETISQDVDAVTYSKASIRAVSTLPGYRLIDMRDVTIDDQKLELHIFSAQPLSEEPERKFYQISTVKDGIGYTITALTPLSVSSGLEKEILLILESFTLRESESGSESSEG